jgi:hypothetical protein
MMSIFSVYSAYKPGTRWNLQQGSTGKKKRVLFSVARWGCCWRCAAIVHDKKVVMGRGVARAPRPRQEIEARESIANVIRISGPLTCLNAESSINGAKQQEESCIPVKVR